MNLTVPFFAGVDGLRGASSLAEVSAEISLLVGANVIMPLLQFFFVFGRVVHPMYVVLARLRKCILGNRVECLLSSITPALLAQDIDAISICRRDDSHCDSP